MSIDGFLCFLTSTYAGYDERVEHGIPKLEEDWAKEDEWKDEANGHFNAEGWEYFNDVFGTGRLFINLTGM